MIRPLAVALVLGLACGGAHARYFTRVEIAAARQALAARAPLADPLLRLQSARVQAMADPLAGELALHAALLDLRAAAPSPALRAAVEGLRTWEPRALGDPDDPDHGRGRAVPVVRVASAAAGTLRTWDVRERTQAALAALAQARMPQSLDDEALALAIDRLPASSLPGVATALAGELPPRALRTLAARLPDAALYRALLAAGDVRESLAALGELAVRLPAPEAVAMLIAASADPELGSAAVLALAPLAGAPAARTFLLANLGDERLGGSCAQALALAPAPDPALAEHAVGTSLAAQRARLALRLRRDAELEAWPR